MRIAVSGGIASGKSTILHMLQERGIPTVSADTLARDILWDPGVQDRLMRRFDASEPISPVVLRSLISEDEENRRAINRIMHPVVAERLESANALVFEVPLLFETCLHVSFDAIWVAFCSRETRSKRLAERYGNEGRFDPISWQLDSEVGVAFADAVIRTDVPLTQTLESLLQEAKRWHLPLVVS